MLFSKRVRGWYTNLPPIKFSLTTALFSVSTQIVFALSLFALLALLASPEADESLRAENTGQDERPDPVKVLLLSVLVAPILETAIFQYGLITLLRKFLHSRGWVLFISALAFSLFHLRRSELSAMQALISGSYFANAFVLWLDKTNQPWLAARVTCLSHMLHNLAYFGMSFVPASLIF